MKFFTTTLLLCLSVALYAACEFGASYPLFIVFETDSPIEIGSAVLDQGLQIGIVEEVTLEDTKTTVQITIDAEIRIPEGSTFTLVDMGIFGGKSIDISFAKEAKEVLQPHATVGGSLAE